MGWNVDTAVAKLQNNAEPTSIGWCAKYTRIAIEAGGVTLTRHASAKDYGPSLTAVGFVSKGKLASGYQRGDVAVIQNFGTHKHGHMQMFDGRVWISDFKQRDFWPGTAYRNAEPEFEIFRYPNVTPKPEPGDSIWTTTPYPGIVLKKGAKGTNVKIVQERLLELGYDIGRWGADGDFGDATDKAVRAFQTNHGLEVDGKVGSDTWARLFEAGPKMCVDSKLTNDSPNWLSQPADNQFMTPAANPYGANPYPTTPPWLNPPGQ